MIAAIRFVSMVISGSLLVLLQLPLRVSGQESMACPFQGSVIPLTQSLSMRAVRDLTTEMLHVQMTSSLGGWIGFALSPTGQMVGSVAAVGQLVPNLETAWYSLNGKTRAQVVPVPDVTLEDATMVQTESTSVFTFSIPLPDVPSGAAVRFIYGAGGTPALGYHLIRGSREFVFDECPPPTMTGSPTPAPSALIPETISSEMPAELFSDMPSDVPSGFPTLMPSDVPSDVPSPIPTTHPTVSIIGDIESGGSDMPSDVPSDIPSDHPSDMPSRIPSMAMPSSPNDVPTVVVVPPTSMTETNPTSPAETLIPDTNTEAPASDPTPVVVVAQRSQSIRRGGEGVTGNLIWQHVGITMGLGLFGTILAMA